MNNPAAKYLTISIIVLLLLNTALVVFLIVDRNQTRGNGSRGRTDIAALMAKELKMTDAQRQQHLQFRESYYKETRSLYDSIRRARVTLFTGAVQTNTPDTLIAGINEKINHWQNTINQLTVDYLKRVRGILSATQQKGFDQFMLRMMQRNRRDSSRSN
jgi:Spy/CpxP family protein refolding chaperone